jgi:hypothetical protein
VAAKKEIDRLRAQERELRQRQEQIRIEKERIKRKEIIKVDPKCLKQSIC